LDDRRFTLLNSLHDFICVVWNWHIEEQTNFVEVTESYWYILKSNNPLMYLEMIYLNDFHPISPCISLNAGMCKYRKSNAEYANAKAKTRNTANNKINIKWHYSLLPQPAIYLLSRYMTTFYIISKNDDLTVVLKARFRFHFPLLFATYKWDWGNS
jgi:hypothetical protein